MTRGKHQRSATLRREDADVAATIAGYQLKVARLAAENADLRGRLEARERTASAETRRLRAERDEAAAPQVEALSIALRVATDERDAARARARRTMETWERAAGRMTAHFREAHGRTGLEAVEDLGQLCGIEAGALLADDQEFAMGQRLGAGAVERLQRARGQRR